LRDYFNACKRKPESSIWFGP